MHEVIMPRNTNFLKYFNILYYFNNNIDEFEEVFIIKNDSIVEYIKNISEYYHTYNNKKISVPYSIGDSEKEYDYVLFVGESDSAFIKFIFDTEEEAFYFKLKFC